VRCESSTALSFSLNHFRLLENTPQFANNAWQNNTHEHILPQLAKLFKGYENKTIRNNGFPNTVPLLVFFSFLMTKRETDGDKAPVKEINGAQMSIQQIKFHAYIENH